MNAKYYMYRNLHTNTFSIKYKGLVIEHPTIVIMKDVKFKVSENGRQNVLKEKRKNVHATVVANEYKIVDDINITKLTEVYYNPYTTPTFIIKDTNEPIYKVDIVYGYKNKIYIRTT